jgi:tetratricopeptide (TPR) repeat protein
VRLRKAALERLARIEDDSALVLYRAAVRADPAYFPAALEYVGIMWIQFRWEELRREFPVSDSSSVLASCLGATGLQHPDNRRAEERWRALEARFGPTPCTDAFLLGVFNDYSPERGARVLRDSPEVRDLRSAVANGMMASGRFDDADALLRSSAAALTDPISSVQFAIGQIAVLLARNDSTAARARWRSLDEETRRDPRPRARLQYLLTACNSSLMSTGIEAVGACREGQALVRGHQAGFLIWDLVRRPAKALSDGGAFKSAMPLFDRAVAIADSLGRRDSVAGVGMRLISYTQRGRVLFNLGQVDLALRDLRAATTIAPRLGAPYYQADAYHQLLHAYERAGRWTDAAFASDSFVMVADMLPRTPAQYMSRHDAGNVRWAAGWHASAVQSFDAMVRVIDRQNDGHPFAGEYYERVGKLGRAIDYYRIGTALPHPDPRNFAGMARGFEALGLPDSAEAAARRHDALSDAWPLLERPLLPDVLFRRGRRREAIALAESWAKRETSTGNIQGAARSWVHVAELRLVNGDGRAAEAAARAADSLSRALLLVAEGIEARTILGRVLVAGGRLTEGLTELRDAARLAAAHPSTAGTLATSLALADALVATGNSADALGAYRQAAGAVERMTAGLDEDVNRAGFKSRHLAPFDGAIRVLASRKASGNASAALQWSVRRKAAALALSGHVRSAGETALDPDALRRQLRAEEALIDYTVLDSSIVAIVARASGLSLVSLAVPPARITSWIAALRRPLVSTPGGRIDLAHARFDATIAESLYAATIAPLGRSLSGATRLAIVPDGALWYVPFAALVPARASWLVERYEIRMLPSAAYLGRSQATAPLRPGFRVDAFTYSVAGGTAEVDAIEAALGKTRVGRRDGPTATEKAALGSTSDVLHIAAHGIVDDRDALASHLRLSPSGPDDGLLHLSEVTASRITPRLVVLTACEAVSGRLYAGEGLVGLARAFLLSGARQVVASQWPVDASAGRLTSVFYTQLAGGATPSAALRSAQLSMLASPSTAHPIHWAGFVVFGGLVR